MDSEPKVLRLTERELTEIKHALFYAIECNHGTVGHNMLIIIDKLARHVGFGLELTDGVPVFTVRLPTEAVEITKG